MIQVPLVNRNNIKIEQYSAKNVAQISRMITHFNKMSKMEYLERVNNQF